MITHFLIFFQHTIGPIKAIKKTSKNRKNRKNRNKNVIQHQRVPSLGKNEKVKKIRFFFKSYLST